MKVIVKFYDMNDRGVVGWLNRLPEEKQYKDIVLKTIEHIGTIRKVNDIGFYIENESDPLLAEFKRRFPNTVYRFEE